MKNRVRKKILLTGMLCAMSAAAAACGGANEPAAAEEQQEDAKRTAPEAETGNSGFAPETEAGNSGSAPETEAGNSDSAPETEAGNSDSAPEMAAGSDNTPPAENVPAVWSDTPPDLEGDIKELQDGRLTVVKAITETGADGGEIMAVPSAGADDSEFDKVPVTYDENTLFAIQTIYDGGARFEMSEATAADLAEGQGVKVWGSPSGETLDAAQICIIKVI